MTAPAAAPALPNSVGGHASSLRWLPVSIATAVVILAVALLPLLTPFFIHPALDAADSAGWLGLTAVQAHQFSDQSVQELVFGPGTFAFPAPDGTPFYQPDEASHLRDARALLYLFLGVALLSAVVVGFSLARSRNRLAAWRAVRRGAAGLIVGVIVLGVVGFFAFEPAFNLFHEIFFPGGNWAFGPTSRMIRLYPELFWEIASASLGLIAVALAAVTWWVARGRERAAAEAGRAIALHGSTLVSAPGSTAKAPR